MKYLKYFENDIYNIKEPTNIIQYWKLKNTKQPYLKLALQKIIPPSDLFYFLLTLPETKNDDNIYIER